MHNEIGPIVVNNKIDESRQFLTLDGMRGIAAFWIVVLHIPHFTGGWYLPGSFLAVDLFFVLSGFVIANAYEKKFTDGMKFQEFVIVRVIRLYPLYALSSVLGLLVAILALFYGGISVEWNKTLLFSTIPLSAIMIPTPKLGKTDVLFPLNPVLWSIFFEIIINIVYAAIQNYIKRTVYLIGLCIISAAFLIYIADKFNAVDSGYSWETFVVGLVRVFYSFFCGVFIHRALDRSKRKSSHLAAVPMVVMMIVFACADTLDEQLVAILIVLPATVWFAVHFEPKQFKKILSALGGSSYALYVLHKPIYQLALGFMILVLPFQPEALAPWIGIVYLGIIIAVSVVVHARFDVPLRRFLNNRWALLRSVPKKDK